MSLKNGQGRKLFVKIWYVGKKWLYVRLFKTLEWFSFKSEFQHFFIVVLWTNGTWKWARQYISIWLDWWKRSSEWNHRCQKLYFLHLKPSLTKPNPNQTQTKLLPNPNQTKPNQTMNQTTPNKTKQNLTTNFVSSFLS